MDIDVILRGLGGSARWSELKGRVSRRRLKRAVSAGDVIRTGSAYSLPPTTRAQRLAKALKATRSHATAAAHWGFALPPEDDVVRLTVPFKAQRSTKPSDVRLAYRDLPASDVARGVTSPLRTVVDCLKDEPLRIALSVGDDSALRSGKVSHAELAAAVGALRGPGSLRARSRLGWLDARSANAFESSARAILIEAEIVGFEPQVDIRHKRVWIGRVDFAHHGLRIVIECDGFETHGTLEAMTKDLSRHTCLTAAGWRSLRFTWYQVMFQPDWVRDRILDTIEIAGQERSAILAARGRDPETSAA